MAMLGQRLRFHEGPPPIVWRQVARNVLAIGPVGEFTAIGALSSLGRPQHRNVSPAPELLCHEAS